MEDFASVVPGSSDSPSLLSEPPDIRNWFSSYIYESFPLDSLAKESESEVGQCCVGEADKENVGDYKARNRRLSQNPDGKLSESLPSEPPDIGNWFSSYVYESPVLDTSDGLVLSLTGESERVKESENKKDIGKEATKLDRSNVSHVEFDHEPFSSAKVTDFSHSPSLLSEPPNVRIWFSSYAYESPLLSETRELVFASPEKDQLIIDESDTEDDNSSGIFRKTRSKQEIILPGRLQSNDYTENITKDMLAKESSEEKEIRSSSDNTHSDKNLEKKSTNFWNVSTEELKRLSCCSHVSFPCEPKQEPSFRCRMSPCNPKPQSSLNHGASSRELKPPLSETVTMNCSRKSPRKATQKARLVENAESKTWESDDKENVHRESTETGFVTMKRDRFQKARERDSRTKPDRGILVECSRSKGWEKISGEEDEEIRKKRRVLGETTNLQCSRSMEMTGKWICPQKSKANLAPPLKQLRLDAWVHRHRLTREETDA